MLTRLMDIVVLVAELRTHDRCSVEDLGRELTQRGYAAEEVDEAVSWYASCAHNGVRSTTGTRVLSGFERMSMSNECQGYLLRLYNLGIIDIEQFDRIVARAIPVRPEKVHLGDVKEIASAIAFDSDPLGGEDESYDHQAGDSPI
jgi:uncharacterized protein Smg (DUF494 family)